MTSLTKGKLRGDLVGEPESSDYGVGGVRRLCGMQPTATRPPYYWNYSWNRGTTGLEESRQTSLLGTTGCPLKFERRTVPFALLTLS